MLFRFKTVLFGSTYSQYLLQATISHHLKKIGKEHLLDNLFVDDITFYSKNIDEILEFQDSAVKAFNEISMPLGKYVSNSDEVNKELLARGLIKEAPTECKILGMSINLKLDSFIINLPDFNITKPTLTSVLSDHASVWDVLGFIEPIRAASKSFINTLHKAKLDWKDNLNVNQIET